MQDPSVLDQYPVGAARLQSLQRVTGVSDRFSILCLLMYIVGKGFCVIRRGSETTLELSGDGIFLPGSRLSKPRVLG
jgi:hypothetical protein